MSQLTKTRYLAVTYFAFCILSITQVYALDNTAVGRLERMEEQMQMLMKLLQEKDQKIEDLASMVNQLNEKIISQEIKSPNQNKLDQFVEVVNEPLITTSQNIQSAYSPQASTVSLIDVSAIVNIVAGGSDARENEMEILQGGAHDPNRRGFTFQQLELSFYGAVDPYFTGEAHVIFTEDDVELEEAIMTTHALPNGLQIEAGYFFTEFGRVNSQHPHSWDWLDQPIINTRIFGGEGMRGAGLRLGWLTPLPWFSEFHFGAQNASGERMASFNGEGVSGHGHGEGDEEEEELFEEGIGGRPILEDNNEVRDLNDLVYLARWVNGFEITDSLSTQIGLSSLYGPNNSGADQHSWIYGTDVVFKWSPSGHNLRRPKLVWQTEVIKREFDAAPFQFASDNDTPADPTDDININLSALTLKDWGVYSQFLYTVNRNLSIGARYEFVGGKNNSAEEGVPYDRSADPFRNDRHRISPLIMYQTSEFTKLRLQYSYDQFDRTDGLSDRDAHSLWVGLEVLWGKHPAHTY